MSENNGNKPLALEQYNYGAISLNVRQGAMSEWDKVITREVQSHYTFPGLDYSQQQTILDVGCNIGAFSLFAKAQNPAADIVGVEVDDENFQLARYNTSKTDITVYHARLGYEQGDFVLETLPCISGSHRVVRRGEHKVIPPAGYETSYHEITVLSMTLEDIMEKHQWERINVLKLDCEGAEYDIIPHACLETLAACDHIVGEYHDGIVRFSAECLSILMPHFEVMSLQASPDWGRFWLRRWER